MLGVLRTTWPLLLGILLLMVGNGVQGTLLGIRGGIEGFSTSAMSVVMAAYFLGFLGGSRITPDLIRNVGHVRVFAALGSMISAILVLYPAVPDWVAWAVMRVLIGFCFAGVYVTAESWLNNAATNETRGQALSLYMIVQMVGIITSQAILNLGDPSGYELFIIPSVLVSLAFTPILLSATPSPGFERTRGMSFAELFRISPLGCAGMLLTGGVFSAMFGMASVWGTLAGLSVPEITIFVGTIYVGGLVAQYPIGWLSDRMDRRRLVVMLAGAGGAILMIGAVFDLPFALLLVLSVVMGGVTNPVYSLLIAHTNDFLKADQMASASSGLLFLNGLGAIGGPLVTGWLMEMVGPGGFFLFIGSLLALLAAYGGWRMLRRPSSPKGETGSFVPLSPVASTLAVEAVLEAKGDDDAGRARGA
jgi:MFS family permease